MFYTTLRIALGSALLAGLVGLRSGWGQEVPPNPETNKIPADAVPADAPTAADKDDLTRAKAVVSDLQADLAKARDLAGSRIEMQRIEGQDNQLIVHVTGSLPDGLPRQALVGFVRDWQQSPNGTQSLQRNRVAAIQMTEKRAPSAPATERLSGESRSAMNRYISGLSEKMSVDPYLQSVPLGGWRVDRLNDNARRLEIELLADDHAWGDALQDLAAREIATDSYWMKATPPITDVVVTVRRGPASNSARMARYIMEGNTAFRRCDWHTARLSFQAALRESPEATRREVLNYWCVLCDMAMLRYDLVEERLAWLLEANPLGSSSPLVATALESIQGPFRSALLASERRVLMERAYRQESPRQLPPVENQPPDVMPYEEYPRPSIPQLPPPVTMTRSRTPAPAVVAR